MCAKLVVGWIKKGWTKFVDPQREERIQGYVNAVHRALGEQREKLNLDILAEKLDMDDEEREEVVERLYSRCVSKVWSDNDFTENEQRSLSAIAKLLGIDEADAKSAIHEEGLRAFTEELSKAFADGVLDDEEFAKLERICKAFQTTPARLIQSEFSTQGEDFVRNLFLKSWESGNFDEAEWQRIREVLKRLGISEQEFREGIAPSVQTFLEHLLADAKNDGVITEDEEAVLEWILQNLISSQSLQRYVRTEIGATKRFAAIRSGKLPSLPAPEGIALRSGEIVHFLSATEFTQVKRKGGEVVQEKMAGTGVVTDDRFLFISSGKSLQVTHSKILGYQRMKQGLEVQCAGNSAGIYQFEKDFRVGAEIWITAIGRANQTVVSKLENEVSRHISRDVRQRVWQRFGGRCADCHSDQYLEFDHIIPVARGGGNSDNNIQLLCRGCNSKKSDAI